jgi:hypothetical protein
LPSSRDSTTQVQRELLEYGVGDLSRGAAISVYDEIILQELL